jgi:serine/threonine protein kinase
MTSETRNISRVYTHALFDNRELLDFNFIEFPIYLSNDSGLKSDIELKKSPYKLLNLIGRGSSGKVYRAENIETGKIYAVKIFFNTDEKLKLVSVQKEIRILNHLSKSSLRIIKLVDIFYTLDDREKLINMVFEYSPISFSQILFNSKRNRLSSSTISNYLRQILKSLDHCHSKGIIHCDVKPANLVLLSSKKQLPETKETKETKEVDLLKLIDFGHSQFYWPDEKYTSAHLGTTEYLAPEILFKSDTIHYSVDVWSVGCIFLQMLFPSHSHLYFSLDNNSTRDGQIEKLNKRFGTRVLKKFCEKYGLRHFKLDFCGGYRSWPSFLKQLSLSINDKNALDLLEKLLDLDPISRITCKEALNHLYFSEEK